MKYKSFLAVYIEKIAYEYGKNAKPGDIFCLSGNLGAGKTVFAKGFAKGLEYEGNVTSPTFTIVNEYEGGRIPIYHFDLYRLEGGELESIGCEEYFYGNGVCLIEWPEAAMGSLQSFDDFDGSRTYTVNITIYENSREIKIENFSH
jgi:tRNA threonylcarbamoyladenosine biosynthesis protein TsaE